MKTKLFVLIVLILLPLGMVAQIDPIEARLKAEYGNDNVKRYGDGTKYYPIWYMVTLNGKVGAWDKYGSCIILPRDSRYDYISFLYEDNPAEDWYTFIIGRNGKVGLFTVWCDDFSPFDQEVIPPIYDDFFIHEETIPRWYEVKLNGKVGAIDADGNRIIPVEYDSVSRYGKGRTTDPFWYEVKLNGKVGAFDKDGKQIRPLK